MRKRQSILHIGLMGADRLIFMDFCDPYPGRPLVAERIGLHDAPRAVFTSILDTGGSIGFFR